MSLLSTASRLNTANQINDWNTSCIQSMNQAKQTFSFIATQRVAMETNPEFTQEDKDEVDALIASLTTMASSLIP
jgi:hypothetical protein